MADEVGKIKLIEADIDVQVKGADKVNKTFNDLFSLVKDRSDKIQKAFNEIKLIPDVGKQKSELQNLFRVIQIQSKDLKNSIALINKEMANLSPKDRKA